MSLRVQLDEDIDKDLAVQHYHFSNDNDLSLRLIIQCLQKLRRLSQQKVTQGGEGWLKRGEGMVP